MSDLLYCCVILTLANPLWIQALPANSSSVETGTNQQTTKPSSPLQCPKNEFFNHVGKACELTCENPVPQESCNEMKVADCQCIEGYVRNKTGECVNMSHCLQNIPFDLESTSLQEVNNKSTTNVTETQTTKEPSDTLSNPDNKDHSWSPPPGILSVILGRSLEGIPFDPDEARKQEEYEQIIAFFNEVVQTSQSQLNPNKNSMYY